MPRIPIAPLLSGFLLLHPLLAGTVKFLPWDEEIAARKLGIQNGAKVEEIHNLHPAKRTKAYNSGSGESPVLLVALDKTSEDGKPVAVEIKSLAGVDSPLVLLVPDPKNPTGVRPFVIPDSAAKFPWGTSRFINATGRKLLVRHDKDVKLLPTSWDAVDISSGGDTRNIGVMVAAPEQRDKLLYSAVWEQSPDLRKLIFILPDPRSGADSVLLKNIPEDRRAAEAPASATSN